ncbi:MAG: hypothetical protein EOP23_23045, partial [Hyphomicrobiales bacterium]
ALATLLLAGTALAEPNFNRIATFQVPLNLPADRLLLGVGIGEQSAGLVGGDDLGHRLLLRVAIGRQIQRHLEGGDAVEIRLGKRSAGEQERRESCEGEGLAHWDGPVPQGEEAGLPAS